MTPRQEIRYTLLTDGSADAVLLEHITWLFHEHTIAAIQPAWADLRRLPKPPKHLTGRVTMALELYPCDILFVHRDAESESRQVRVEEIRAAAKNIELPLMCVVPVHMQEAWLLFNEDAIRRAAGNPKGRVKLSLPQSSDAERLSDPKAKLHELLLAASELPGRRRKSFSVSQAAHLVATYTSDFSPLRCLEAFSALERDLEVLLAQLGWM